MLGARFEQPKQLQEAFDRRQVTEQLRALLNTHSAKDPFWRDPPDDPDETDRFILDLLVPPAPELDDDPRWFDVQLVHRHRLLHTMAKMHYTLAERRKRFESQVVEECEFWAGWLRMCHSGEHYQLRDRKPWWRPGDPILDIHVIEDLERDPRKLKREGFELLSQGVYRERVRVPVLRERLARPHELCEELIWAARAAVLLITPKRDWRRYGIPGLVSRRIDELAALCQQAIANQRARIPMKPMYSLPRESNNMASFFSERSITLDPSRQHARADLEHARVTMGTTSSGQQQVLFFDRELTNRKSGSQDAYISVTLPETMPDVLSALFSAIEQLDVDPNIFEHVPRVCAGMFAAAQRDAYLECTREGGFWDTETGYRLCRMVGFDPDSQYHQHRVTQVKHLLRNITLHRALKSRGDDPSTHEKYWSEPIIQPLESTISLKPHQRDGLSGHHTLRGWLISLDLWRMTQVQERGGTPAFMSIDERAFQLDRSSSLPFNLYWTIINRAYISSYTMDTERRRLLEEQGYLRVGMRTLYNWSGMEAGTARAGRVRKKIREALEAMRHHGLLLDWSCEQLTCERPVSFEELMTSELHLNLCQEQVEVLPARLS